MELLSKVHIRYSNILLLKSDCGSFDKAKCVVIYEYSLYWGSQARK